MTTGIRIDLIFDSPINDGVQLNLSSGGVPPADCR